MSDDRIRITYHIEDGHVGKSRPQHVEIRDFEINDDMSDDELRDMLDELIEDDMQNRVHPYTNAHAEFITWAREVLAKRGDE